MPPTDPLICRFLRTGHGQRPGLEGADRARIWRRQSCRRIDFDMVMERLPNPKGDRVKITMSGKFLPFKYYGARGKVPEYGLKEG
jgi:cyanate lyase